jgi:hypothetical protein
MGKIGIFESVQKKHNVSIALALTVFSDKDAERDSSELMWMDEFDLNQPYNSTLSVNCLASGYFAAAAMQYALQFENPFEIRYIRGKPWAVHLYDKLM